MIVKKMIYCAPELEIVEVAVERGFAQTDGTFGADLGGVYGEDTGNDEQW